MGLNHMFGHSIFIQSFLKVFFHLYRRHLLENVNYLLSYHLLIKYILKNSLEIILEGKRWCIINDIDLLTRPVNFLAEEELVNFFDNPQRSPSDKKIFGNLNCKVRSSSRGGY